MPSTPKETRLQRIIDNKQAVIDYMCQEIAKAFFMPVQSPTDTVQTCRDAAKYLKEDDSTDVFYKKEQQP